MVQLSQAYLEWEQVRIQQGRLEGERRTVLRQLDRRFGPLSDDRRHQVQTLSLFQIEDLADALLDFVSEANLSAWLQALDDRRAKVSDRLQERWKAMTPEMQTQIQQLSPTQLAVLAEALPQLADLKELADWLATQDAPD